VETGCNPVDGWPVKARTRRPAIAVKDESGIDHRKAAARQWSASQKARIAQVFPEMTDIHSLST